MLIQFHVFDTIAWVQFAFALLSFCGACLIWMRPRYRGLTVLLFLNVAYMTICSLKGQGVSQQALPYISLSLGPAIYLFVRALVYRQHGIGWRDALWAVPVFTLAAIDVKASSLVVLALTVKIMFTYAAVRLVRRYHRASFHFVANAESTQLSWLYYVLISFIGVSLLEVIQQQSVALISADVMLAVNLFFLIAAMLICLVLVFKAWLQQPLFDDLARFDEWEPEYEAYLQQGVSDQARQDFKQVEKVMAHQSLYLKPNLSLQTAAEAASLSTAETAKAIEQGADCNFCDYVNGLRVEALKIAIENGKYNLSGMKQLASALGLGVNYRFASLFRRFSGFSPSEYLQHIK